MDGSSNLQFKTKHDVQPRSLQKRFQEDEIQDKGGSKERAKDEVGRPSVRVAENEDSNMTILDNKCNDSDENHTNYHCQLIKAWLLS